MKGWRILDLIYVLHFATVGHGWTLSVQGSSWRHVTDSTSERSYISGNYGCCSRQPKFVTIVLANHLGTDIQLDVGHCRKSCKKPHAAALESQIAATVMEDSTIKECKQPSVCGVARSRIRRLSSLRGIREIAVIEACECRPKAPCSRRAISVVLYPGTPYQTHLDVGVCSGQCDTGGCKPIRNRTRSVPGPNGSDCHDVIEECGCASSCYRMSAYETVYDYSDANGQNASEPTVKEINIGRCVGVCAVGPANRRCVYQDKTEPGKCLAGLYTRQTSTCSPSQFDVHRYVTIHRETHEIIAVKSCGCV